MNVSVDIRTSEKAWDENAIIELARFALELMEVPQACELSVSLVSRKEIQQLNERYRGVDAPTDVLSFELDSPWDTSYGSEPVEIGDVVICPEVIDEQRTQFHTSFEQEASLMLVHSILHLLGYDHMHKLERTEMEAKEKEILDAYGLKGIR